MDAGLDPTDAGTHAATGLGARIDELEAGPAGMQAAERDGRRKRTTVATGDAADVACQAMATRTSDRASAATETPRRPTGDDRPPRNRPRADTDDRDER